MHKRNVYLSESKKLMRDVTRVATRIEGRLVTGR